MLNIAASLVSHEVIRKATIKLVKFSFAACAHITNTLARPQSSCLLRQDTPTRIMRLVIYR